MAIERRAAATFHDDDEARAQAVDRDEVAGEIRAPRSSWELALQSEFLNMMMKSLAELQETFFF